MSEWVLIAPAAAIVEGEAFASEVGEEAIALYRLDGEIHCIGDICTHEHVRLSEGWVDGDRIECPLHQACFEIRTGKVLSGPAYEDVKRYEVKVEGDSVFVRSGQ